MEESIAIEENLNKMEKIISISEKILSKVGNNNSENVKSLLNELEKLKRDLREQTRKILKNNYELAVIGRVKAGKSTLLNAWLQSDLLPTDHNSCTYTTIEIRSCKNRQRRYNLEYFDKSELESLISEFEKIECGYLSKVEIEKIYRLWSFQKIIKH